MALSNLDLLNKCKRYILKDSQRRSDVDTLIEDALITASREIANLGKARPLAWLREDYDEIFTSYYATVTDITQADPGVITATSNDPLIGTGEFDFIWPFNFVAHGFTDGDIIYIDGVNGSNTVYELNARFFRVVNIDGETMSLKTLDGQTAINTTNYVEYSSGGYLYHAGRVLPKSSIEPTGGTADYEWDIKRVYDVQFDNYPANPITEEAVIKKGLNTPGSRPKFWRYQKYSYSLFNGTNTEHILFWYPFASQRYNIRVHMEKVYPDLSSFDGTKYPPHPEEIHDYIWHRALSLLSTHSEKAMRRGATKDGSEFDNTKIEILNANYWISKAVQEETEIIDYSRNLTGGQAYISQGMSA